MINLDKKLLLLGTCILIVVFGIFFSLFYQRDTYQSNVVDYEESDIDLQKPDNFFREVGLMFFNDQATISWQLESTEIKGFSRENILDLISVKVNVFEAKENDSFDNEDRITYSNLSNSSKIKKLYDLNASEANYNINDGLLELSGPVIINRDNINLELGSVLLEDGAKSILAENGVRLKSPDYILKGSSLESDFALSDITIKGDNQEQAYLSWEKGSDSD